MQNMKILLMLTIFLALALGSPKADSTTFCNGLFTPGNVLSGTTPVSMLSMALLIMLVMLIIVGIAYALGYALKVDKLVKFAKSEIGEVAITLIIVFVFVGSFMAVSATTPNGMFALSNNQFKSGIYITDCSMLYGVSINFISPIISLMVNEIEITALTSLSVEVAPVYFGIGMSPLSGLAVVNSVIKMMINIGAVFIGISIATLFLLLFVYKLFPLFFFLGIVLRTIPWTRAAGGAFLGLFIAFFIVLPLMIYVFATQVSPSVSSSPTGSYSSLLSSLLSQGTPSSVNGALQSSSKSVDASAIKAVLLGFIQNVLEPSLFYVVSIVLSFIIAYNFMEAIGDMLGAPSLSSSNTLKKLL